MGATLLLLGVPAFLVVFVVRVPTSVTLLPARIDGIIPLLAPGKRNCLRIQTDRFTGRITARHAVEAPQRSQPNTTE